jgi:ribokinase
MRRPNVVDPPHVVCLGDLMVDVTARLPGALEIGSDLPARVEWLGGGSAANTVSWLSMLGVPTTLIARVGDDILGEWAREDVGWPAGAGVATDALRPTGTCIVLIGPDGERTMVPDAGANGGLEPDDIDPDDFAPGRYLHVSGYALFGGARPAALHALSLAREAGMTVSVGAASAAPLRDAGSDVFLDWIGNNLLLFANRDEARVLTGLDNPGSAAKQLAERVGRVVVTCGARGAIWCDATNGIVYEPTTAVEPLDTTGAGDAFAAGVLCLLGQGAEPTPAMRTGNMLASDACRRVGGRAPMWPASPHP